MVNKINYYYFNSILIFSVEATCGETISTNCTYLVSPNYPSTYNEARTCLIRVTRMDDTCQLRMDFSEFQSVQPSDTGLFQFRYFQFSLYIFILVSINMLTSNN